MLHGSDYADTIASKIEATGTVYTHGGGIHADDVMSAALINKFCDIRGIDRPNVLRINDSMLTDEIKESSVVFDIGKGDFDHHQTDNESHDTGEPYAAFGKLFEVLGEEVYGDYAEAVKECVVKVIDLCDNTENDNPVSAMVREMNPLYGETFSTDDAFNKAVSIAETVLDDRLEIVKEGIDNGSSIDEMKDGIMSLTDKESAIHEERGSERAAAFENIDSIITLSDRDTVHEDTRHDGIDRNYRIINFERPGIPYSEIRKVAGEMDREDGTKTIGYTFPQRGAITFKPLDDTIVPDRWKGADKETLGKEVEGMTFCHASGISVSFETKEALMEACGIMSDEKIERIEDYIEKIEKYIDTINLRPHEYYDKLEEGAVSKDVEIRSYLAREVYPKESPFTIHLHQNLSNLINDPESSVRSLIAEKIGSFASPKINDQLADKFSEDPDKSIRMSVARNAATPLNVLDKLSKDSSSEVKIKVVENAYAKTLSDAIVNRLANDPDPNVRIAAINSYRVPASTLEKLSNDENTNVRQAVAQNEKTPSETLDKLSHDSEPSVRAGVAKNFFTSPETLKNLASDENSSVREIVAHSWHTPPNELAKLSHDSVLDVRFQVANNPYTPIEGLFNLVKDENKSVSNSADNTLQNEYEPVELATRNDAPSILLDRLAYSSDAEVRFYVAQNENTSPETLDRLSSDEDEQVKQEVALNKNTSPETLDKLSADEGDYSVTKDSDEIDNNESADLEEDNDPVE